METIKRAAAEAVEHARIVTRGGRRWRQPTPAQIKALRVSLNMSQAEFARTFGFDLDALKSWELDRRQADPQNSLLFAMIETDANFVKAAVQRVTLEDA